MRFLNLIFAIAISLLSSISVATTLPTNLIALDSSEGAQLFKRSYSSSYFWPIALQFVTQQNRTYCSIASSIMVLNALKVPAPNDPIYAPYKIFTQDNFFTPNVQKILPVAIVKKQGSSLEQISHALQTFSVFVKTIHANETSIDQFRDLAEKTMHNHNAYIIVNFLRTGLKEEGGGHMSPIVAYDKSSDRFLLLDVARYRYPSIWVKTADLWNAMHTIDTDFNSYRGFIIIKQK